ncbi:MAG: CHASE2 domain-containing protein, partial [Deltaproteobacteria bacterium]
LHFIERQKLGAARIPSHVVVIAEDERSVQKVGRWPWPRAVYATLIDRLTAAGAASIAMDVAFLDTYDRVAGETDLLSAAIARSGRTVQSFILLKNSEVEQVAPAVREAPLERIAKGALESPRHEVIDEGLVRRVPSSIQSESLLDAPAIDPPLPEIANAATWFGFFNTVPDPDGVIRHVPLVGRAGGRLFFPSLETAAVAVACGTPSPANVTPLASAVNRLQAVALDCAKAPLLVPVGPGGRMTLDFPVPWLQMPRLSAVDVVDGNFHPETVRGRVALVAATAAGTFDIRSTPIDSNVPGGVTHAAAIEQMLTGRYLRRPDGIVLLELAWLLGAGLLFGLLFARASLGLSVGGLALGAVGFHALSYAAFAHGLDICSATPELELFTLFPVALGFRYLTEEREKRAIRQAFRFYLTGSVMDAVLADPSRLKLGGDKRVLTVLFSDIRGFTTLSEKLPPEKLVQLLNDYLTPMTDIVFENGGTLDKYMGDAIMAFFGAPVEQPDHALRACRTACQMLARLEELRRRFEAEGLPPIEIGIGLSTGPMVVGNMGSQSRFDYTVMGDAVNLGSRLEGANKLYGTRLLVPEGTFDAVLGQVAAREIDLVRVKGKHEPVRIYEILAATPEPLPFVPPFERGLGLFRARRFDEARAAFEEALGLRPGDPPSRLYLARCERMKANPPEGDWDGAYTMETK